MEPTACAEIRFGQRLVVGVGDMASSADPQAILSTYSLGSCIGVAAYDARARVGGLLHLMLPSSSIAPDRALSQPALFADTGLALFFRSLDGLGADRDRIRLMIAGGASVLAGHDPYRIGERNIQATLGFLRGNGYEVGHAEVGGGVNRALHLEMATGIVTLTTPQRGSRIPLAP